MGLQPHFAARQKKVNAEMAIIFTVYNLRRVITIPGVTELLRRLKKWKHELKSCLIKALYGKENFEVQIRA